MVHIIRKLDACIPPTIFHPYYTRTGSKDKRCYRRTTSYRCFIFPSAILNPVHTQPISVAPFTIPNTNVDTGICVARSSTQSQMIEQRKE